MKIVRIYQPGPYETGDIVELSPSASQHVGLVLRMQPGESLILFRGDNHEFPATIASLQKKKVIVSIHAEHAINRESGRSLHLAQSISKGERMEHIIQKATELGVTSITPLLTSRSVVRLDAARLAKKQEQWRAISIAACEQSGRNQLPTIHPTCSLETYLEHCEAQTKLTLHPHASQTWRDYSQIEGSLALLIGPEGGFNDQEVLLAKHHGFHAIGLGPRILRTETAAITAISLFQAVLGDM